MADLTEEEAYAKALRDAATASTETIKQAQVDEYFKNKPKKQKGESNASYNERITQWYKDQPHPDLTPEQAAARATLQWKRTGKAGAGKYVVSYPIGVQFDKTTGKPIIDPETGEAVNLFNPKKTDANLNTGGKTEDRRVVNPDGSTTVFYTDGTSTIIPKYTTIDNTGSANLTFGNTVATDTAKAARQSAYNVLYDEFNKYGLGSLVEQIKGLIQTGTSPSEFSIALQNTDAYKKRFAANQDRIKQGLRALTPAEYINMEDQYQEIMRRWGLPASYYAKGDMGIQEGFNKLIANDVSNLELEDRIATAQNRLINTDVNTLNALRQFYPNITTGDLIAYTLDPTNAIGDIKRKAQAAEIGGAALAQGLMSDVASAEALAKYGITKAQAQEGYQNIGSYLPTATQLSDIYAKQGMGPYSQLTAEQEVFGTAGAAEAARKRKKLAELEKASFSGSSGTGSGALSRDRAMTNQMLGTPGAGAF